MTSGKPAYNNDYELDNDESECIQVSSSSSTSNSSSNVKGEGGEGEKGERDEEWSQGTARYNEHFDNMANFPQATATRRICFTRRTPAPVSSPAPNRICAQVDTRQLVSNRIILKPSPNDHGYETLVQNMTTLSNGTYTAKAWPPITYKSDAAFLPRQMTPFPVVPLLNYTSRTRIDSRPLKAPLQIPEIMKEPALPQVFEIDEGNTKQKYVKTTPLDALQMFISPDAPKGDYLGALGVNGELDLQVFVMVKRRDIINDPVAVSRIAEGIKNFSEWLQDTIYVISNEHMRYSRVYLGVFGVTRLRGSYYIDNKEIPFDLQRQCRKDNEQHIISMMCDHVASTYRWDRTYARQKLVFVVDEPTSTVCSDFTGYASHGCKNMCYALMGNAVKWIPERNRFEDERLAQCTAVHELLHGFALGHANLLDSNYNRELRDTNTGVMGDCKRSAFMQVNAMNKYKLGWLDSREYIDLDTLDRNGVVVTVPDASNSCVVLAATSVLMKARSYSGHVPYPVLTLAISKASVYLNRNVCVMHTYGPPPPRQGNKYGISFSSKVSVPTYKIPTELGSNKQEVVVDLFHPVLGSFLPPYLITQGSPKAEYVSQMLQALHLPSTNTRANMRILVRIEGTYRGHGDMAVRIIKLM